MNVRRKISHVMKNVLGIDKVVLVGGGVAFLIDVVAGILFQPFFGKSLVRAPLRLERSVYGSGTSPISNTSK